VQGRLPKFNATEPRIWALLSYAASGGFGDWHRRPHMTEEAHYVHQLTHEIEVMKDLARGTAEQHDIFHDLKVIGPHDHPLSFYFSVEGAVSNLLEEVNLLGAGHHGLFTADDIYSDVSFLQYNFDYWLL
jgi:hypothetical protein